MQASSPLPPLSPRTKWLIALCLCVLVMLLEFLTYHMAYRIGYDEGMLTTPPVVVQKSDEKAMQNLSRFMADVFASRESLAGILDNREERLAWIRDPELRTETAWGLTRELISRGGVVLALPAARELIDAGYAAGHYRVWAPRADAVAKALLAEHQYTSAYDYLKTAEEGYEKEGMAEPLVRTLQTMSSIDQMLNRNEQANIVAPACGGCRCTSGAGCPPCQVQAFSRPRKAGTYYGAHSGIARVFQEGSGSLSSAGQDHWRPGPGQHQHGGGHVGSRQEG